MEATNALYSFDVCNGYSQNKSKKLLVAEMTKSVLDNNPESEFSQGYFTVYTPNILTSAMVAFGLPFLMWLGESGSWYVDTWFLLVVICALAYFVIHGCLVWLASRWAGIHWDGTQIHFNEVGALARFFVPQFAAPSWLTIKAKGVNEIKEKPAYQDRLGTFPYNLLFVGGTWSIQTMDAYESADKLVERLRKSGKVDSRASEPMDRSLDAGNGVYLFSKPRFAYGLVLATVRIALGVGFLWMATRYIFDSSVSYATSVEPWLGTIFMLVPGVALTLAGISALRQTLASSVTRATVTDDRLTVESGSMARWWPAYDDLEWSFQFSDVLKIDSHSGQMYKGKRFHEHLTIHLENGNEFSLPNIFQDGDKLMGTVWTRSLSE